MNILVKMFFIMHCCVALCMTMLRAQDQQLLPVSIQQTQLERDLQRIESRNEKYVLCGAIGTGFVSVAATAGSAYYLTQHSSEFSDNEAVAMTLTPSFGLVTLYFGIWGVLHAQKKRLEKKIRARSAWLRQDSAIGEVVVPEQV